MSARPGVTARARALSGGLCVVALASSAPARADVPPPATAAAVPEPAPAAPPVSSAASAPAPAPSAPPTGTPPEPPAGGHWVFVPDATQSRPTEPQATSVATAPPIKSERGPVYLHANTWDLNLEGAIGRFYGDSNAWTGFGRVRAGALFIREPLYLALGATYEISNLQKATFGIQGEVLHLDMGFWAQGGGLLDVSGHPGGMLALGWSLFGVEGQVRDYDGRGTGAAVYAKIRFPISIIARLFTSRSPKPAAPP